MEIEKEQPIQQDENKRVLKALNKVYANAPVEEEFLNAMHIEFGKLLVDEEW